MIDNIIGNELFFVYSLIAIVVALIIIIIIVDKRTSKKKPQNLFDTLNMKIIAYPEQVTQANEEETDEVTPELLEIHSIQKENEFKDLEPIKEINIVDGNEDLKETIKKIEEEVYIESELEKTQAQIRIEEITKALKNAEVEEKVEKDKYEKFEEEQEKNAIISYNELRESFDKLYSENEKIQYLEDDDIPINIEELYKMQNVEKESKKVGLEDFVPIKEITKPTPIQTQQPPQSTFKSSPYISPVYGIQKPPIEVQKETDKEIENANQFLQSLKELKNNLD